MEEKHREIAKEREKRCWRKKERKQEGAEEGEGVSCGMSARERREDFPGVHTPAGGICSRDDVGKKMEEKRQINDEEKKNNQKRKKNNVHEMNMKASSWSGREKNFIFSENDSPVIAAPPSRRISYMHAAFVWICMCGPLYLYTYVCICV